LLIGQATLDFNGSWRCVERPSSWSLPKSDTKDKSQSPSRIERGFIRAATKRIGKLPDDLLLDLVNATAIIKIDSENVAVAPCWVEIIEPHNLALHQPLAPIRSTIARFK
jgi:hypothetical protein